LYPDIKDNKIKKLKNIKKSRRKRIMTTKKKKRTIKAVVYDLTKAGTASDEIIDIVETPDVAVWSKGITKKIGTPADKVQQPSWVKSAMTTITDIDYNEGKERQIHMQETVDPANKEAVDGATGSGISLTDKPASFIQRSKKEVPSSKE
jgi:hypothetical protein